MWEKFTQSSKKAIKYATEEAKHFRSDSVDTEHLLLGLLKDEKAFAMKILQQLEVPIEKLRLVVQHDIKLGNFDYDNITFSDLSKEVLEAAFKEARQLKHSHIGTEHLLLGLIKTTGGKASRHLKDFGVTYQSARNMVQTIISQQSKGAKQKTKTPTLDEFGHDLTKEARDSNLDPVIGRQAEINRIIQILSKRTKNNPVLIGDPGVGKTAIVEGLAQMIAKGDVPIHLRGARLISLDLAGLVAGTKFRGEFEDRLKRVMREIMTSEQVIILFIDELHTIIGAGAAEGAIDASNILKPALARGKLRAIGATTTSEFKKHVEKNGALERRFQPVMVNEPTVEQTIEILRGLRKRYEVHHNVEITEEAIQAAARFSHRFVTLRSLPDKAIDLMDEAAAKVHVALTFKHFTPNDLETPSTGRVSRSNALAEEEEEDLPVPLEDFGETDSEDSGDEPQELSEVMKRDLEGATVGPADIRTQRVTEEDIAEVVHAWTGIPVTAIAEEETEKLLRMEDYLHKRLIGQDEAIGAIARALRRSRVGLKDPKRPTGSFLFAGPTGVGKTELAKALAEFLFGDESALIRFDMSEYMEKFSVSRLVGAPPGYVGYDEGGQLTEAIKRRPYSIVLMDEIEKAHPEVFNILLQVMEDGIITDSQGRTVDLKNIILILTSNLGTGEIGMDPGMGFRAKNADDKDKSFDPEKIARQYIPKVNEALKKNFRPEFLNRLDEVVIFKPLSYDQIVNILDKFLARVEKSITQFGITLELSQEAKDQLVVEGFSRTQGARPLRRTVQRRIEDPLSEYLLRREYEPGDVVRVSYRNGEFGFERAEREVAVATPS